MRRIVIILPELLSLTESILDGGLPSLQAFASGSSMFRLSQLEDVETPEARLLGLSPRDVQLRQGPLTISALGADPPARSLHFHLSLLSVIDGVAVSPELPPTPEESSLIASAVTKLNTRLLTFVSGSGLDHGLVWEALGDLETTPVSSVVGSSLQGLFPRGDGEPMLRQYIDDSVNLLGELEFNRRREDEGLSPLNLLWPWGHGIRTPVPNLALRRATPAKVTSNSLRLAGLARLAGYRHCDVGWLGSGLQTRLETAAISLLEEPASILVVDAFREFRDRGELDEAAYFARKLDSDLLEQILEASALETLNLLVAAPSSKNLGLGLEFNSRRPKNSSYPFDERSIEERALPIVDLESAVDQALSLGDYD